MKIVYLIPGTGNYYCGSCLRDHALVMELRDAGHDVKIIPLYLPLMTEAEEAADEIFLGGINSYLKHRFYVFRKLPRWVNRLFDHNALLKLAADKADMTKASELGDLTVETLKGQSGNLTSEFARVQEELLSEKAEILCLSNAMLGAFAEPAAKEGIKVLCTLQGEDAFLNSLQAPWDKQAWDYLHQHAEYIDHYVAVSRYYADIMIKSANLPEEKVSVVYNGINLSGFDRKKQSHNVPSIGFLTQIIPGKGADLLVDAFIELRKQEDMQDVQLKMAGSLVPGYESYVEGLRERLDAAGLNGQYDIATNITLKEKLDFLHSDLDCSVLVLLLIVLEYSLAFDSK